MQVVYNSATALLAGLRLAGERLDLAWVDNRFARPTVLGYRDVNLGVRMTNPRNPRHFDTIEGRRTCVSDTLCAKIRVPDTKNTVPDTFCAKNSV